MPARRPPRYLLALACAPLALSLSHAAAATDVTIDTTLGNSPYDLAGPALDTTTTSITIGSSAGGSAFLNSGSLHMSGSGSAIYVGDSSDATTTGILTFSGSATTNSSASLTLGRNGAIGTVYYDSSGGSAFSTLTLGTNAGNRFYQNGGTVFAGNGIVINGGIYSLSGTAKISYGGMTVNTAGTLFVDGGTIDHVPIGGGGAIVVGAGGMTFNDDFANDELTIGPGLTHDASVGTDGGLTKTGPGKLRLQGANTFNGPISLAGGTLILDQPTVALSNVGVNFNGGTLQYNAPTAGFLSGVNNVNDVDVNLSTTGAALTLSGDVQTSGSAHALNIGAGSGNAVILNTTSVTGPGFSQVNVAGGGIFTLAGPTLGATNSTISVASGGTFNLASNGTFANPITLSAGTGPAGQGALRFSGAGASLTGPITLNASGASTDCTIQVDSGGNLTVAGSFNGSANLVKTGAGALRLSGSNAYTPGTTLDAGTIEIASDTALSTGPITLNGGTLRASGKARTLANPLTVNNSFTLGRFTHFTGNTTLAANVTVFLDNYDNPANGNSTLSNISGPFGLTVSNGPLFGAGTGYLILPTDNSFTGPLTVNTNVRIGANASTDAGILGDIVVNAGGKLQFAKGNVVRDTSRVAVNTGGTLDLNNFAEAIATLSGGGDVTNSAGLTLELGADASFSGNIGGSGALTLQGGNGAATQTLSGNNTYAGGTFVNGGTLRLASAAALPSTGTLAVTAGSVEFPANATDAGTNSVSELTIAAGASVDLANTKLIVTSTPADTIRQYLQAGRLVSSVAQADAQNRQAIGYATAAQLGVSTWGSLAAGPSATVTKLTWLGDANLDGRINADDFALLDRGYAKGLTGWVNGDFNYDNVVTSADYLLIDRVVGQQAGTLSPELLSIRESQFGADYLSDLLASVPEPSAALPLLTLLPAFLPRRSRRRRPA